MSSTSTFASELYMAAYEAARLPLKERRHLIERALSIIAAQRSILSRRSTVVPFPSTGLIVGGNLIEELDQVPDVVTSHLLFECADEITRLRALIEAR